MIYEIVRLNDIELIHGQIATIARMTIFQYHTHNKYARNYWPTIETCSCSSGMGTTNHITPFNTDTNRLHRMVEIIFSRSITFTVTMGLVDTISEYNPVSRISHAFIDN